MILIILETCLPLRIDIYQRCRIKQFKLSNSYLSHQQGCDQVGVGGGAQHHQHLVPAHHNHCLLRQRGGQELQ